MKIALVHNASFPVAGYGGTERVIWWLAKGLSELGHKVSLVCAPTSRCDFAQVVSVDFTREVSGQLPGEIDVFHFFTTPNPAPTRPYVVTIEGNGQRGERFLKNTIFVSANHALRHGSTRFVYNGIDPDDYQFSDVKSDYLVFLAKASWKVKNVKGAIRLAKESSRPLHIMGGKSLLPSFSQRIIWEGMIAGPKKVKLLAKAAGLLFPVIWHEPFGVAVIEALMSGTPVVASRRGSLPELVPPQCGWVCDDEESMLEALHRLPEKKPADCRAWAVEKFHYRAMTANYLSFYERVLAGETLNPTEPVALEMGEKIFPLPRRYPGKSSLR